MVHCKKCYTPILNSFENREYVKSTGFRFLVTNVPFEQCICALIVQLKAESVIESYKEHHPEKRSQISFMKISKRFERLSKICHTCRSSFKITTNERTISHNSEIVSITGIPYKCCNCEQVMSLRDAVLMQLYIEEVDVSVIRISFPEILNYMDAHPEILIRRSNGLL